MEAYYILSGSQHEAKCPSQVLLAPVFTTTGVAAEDVKAAKVNAYPSSSELPSYFTSTFELVFVCLVGFRLFVWGFFSSFVFVCLFVCLFLFFVCLFVCLFVCFFLLICDFFIPSGIFFFFFLSLFLYFVLSFFLPFFLPFLGLSFFIFLFFSGLVDYITPEKHVVVLPHCNRYCKSNLLSHPLTRYRFQANPTKG